MKGTTKNVNTNLNLTSAFGNADVVAHVDMRRKNHELYDVMQISIICKLARLFRIKK
jgi:hypothetical protein